MTFGPVPSRRLGRSLGINTIPGKVCTYSCVYCQIGAKKKMTTKRQLFTDPRFLCDEVKRTVELLEKNNEPIDYLSVVPDGEPTLDSELSSLLDCLASTSYKSAVISNGSLLWDSEVREILNKADWVSVKVDAVSPEVWKRINRPHKELSLSAVHEGVIEFARHFPGTLTTETMFIKNYNDTEEEAREIAELLASVSPETAYLAVPTRPPAVGSVEPADTFFINTAYQIVTSRGVNAECLLGVEQGDFSSHRTVEEDILSITAVHPMSKKALQRLLNEKGRGWSVIEQLLEEDKLIETSYRNDIYYLRKRSS